MKNTILNKIVLFGTAVAFSVSSLASTNTPNRNYQNIITESDQQIINEQMELAKLLIQLKDHLVDYKDLINNRSDTRKAALFATNLTASVLGIVAWSKKSSSGMYDSRFRLATGMFGLIPFFANSLDTITTAPATEAEYVEKVETINNQILKLEKDLSIEPEVATNMKNVLSVLKDFIGEQYLLQSEHLNVSSKRRLALNTKETAVRVMIGFSMLAIFTGGNAGFYFTGYFAGNALAIVSLITSFAYDDVSQLNFQIDEMLRSIDGTLNSLAN